jgi:GT2 family glycosyltransferase
MHNEEADFCLRALKQGFQIATAPDAFVWHGIWLKRGRFGFGNRDFCLDSPLRACLTGRNRKMLLRQHGSFFQKTVFFSCFFLPFTIAYMAIILSHQNLGSNWSAYLRGVRDSLIGKLPDSDVPSNAKSLPLLRPTGDER